MTSAMTITGRAAPIRSRANARVKALRASFRGGAAEAEDVVGIEGEHLIAEAVRSGMRLQAVYVREGSEETVERMGLRGLAGAGAGAEAEVVVLGRDVFAGAVATESPQGVAATVAVRSVEPEAFHGGCVLVLEDLQDPGNLGTLIRSAEAFGVNRIFVTERTVNPWNPKVVRASAGSVFRVPVMRMPMGRIAAEARRLGAVLYAAVAREEGALSVLETAFAAKCGLMIGNEGAGLSAKALEAAQYRVRIPCAVESLNAAVAGSMLLYEAMRQRAAAGSAGEAR